MPDHRIRLRGAWEWTTLPPANSSMQRTSLPTIWTRDPGSPFRLVRRLGCPPIDPTEERISLELIEVPGLVAIRWNGQELERGSEPADRWLVSLELPLLARNTLELEVDIRSVDPEALLQEWGQIALVITSKVSSSGSG